MSKHPLLDLAKESIQTVFNPKQINSHVYKKFNKKLGAFVTLKKKEQLRGCIGKIQSNEPLYKTIIYLSKAACKDSRFMPVTEEEIKQIKIEISILSQPKQITHIDEIVVGRHGVIFNYNKANSIFLPEVAHHHHWTVITLLEQLSIKAGTDKQTWKKATLSIFTAEKIY
tara:strand:- start:204 stop:713 length:510 start_codon:yes stop_codon:yes gene_type:complete